MQLQADSRAAWRGTAALAVAETTSWGILYYSFGVLLAPLGATVTASQATVVSASYDRRRMVRHRTVRLSLSGRVASRALMGRAVAPLAVSLLQHAHSYVMAFVTLCELLAIACRLMSMRNSYVAKSANHDMQLPPFAIL